MIKNATLIVIFLVISFSSNVYAQSVKEAMMAMMKLQTKCSTGISYVDYSPALADAKFPLKLYLDSPEANKYPDISMALNKAMSHYEFVNTVWKWSFSGNQRHEMILESEQAEMFNSVKSLYPDIPVKKMPFGLSWIEVNNIISRGFEAASNETKIASNLFQKIDSSTNSSDDKSEVEQLKNSIKNMQQLIDILSKENTELKNELENIKTKNKKK